MGSGSSKIAGGGAEPSSAVATGGKRLRGVLGSSCFGAPDAVPDDQEVENVRSISSETCAELAAAKPDRDNHNGCIAVRVPQTNKISSVLSSDTENEGETRECLLQTAPGGSASTSQAAICQASGNSSSHSHSRFGFISDRIGFRLGRAASLGSSGGRSLVAASLSFSNGGIRDHVNVGFGSSLRSSDENPENIAVDNDFSRSVGRENTIGEATGSAYSDRDHAEVVNPEIGHLSRRSGLQGPLEGSARFSRTLSVGRLRDRVLRRTYVSEGIFGSMLLEDRYPSQSGQLNGRRVMGGRPRSPSFSDRRNEPLLPTPSSNHSPRTTTSTDNMHSSDFESPQLREASNRDWLEHRSAFLERRRRIRSQVRALQRLGSRFENLSGHDRSCILSSQHRTGRCTCRTSNRASNPDDDTSTRASISRIVMLAEALFEVLEEIHQQSVVLSSRPSVSSIGSVPAPKEVVECMPVTVYTRQHNYKNEDPAQCYICLLEYEEGDCMRMLPCQHEFHQTCIDKWLKEIHRVCPLCRGDVCRSLCLIS